jgi:uncharacterized protein
MGTQIVSLILGIILGASLVLAGFTDPDRIIKALRIRDINIIRSVAVIFLIAIIGTYLLKILGTVEIENKPAAIVSLIIGGLLFGAGMGFTGYTPGTSLAGVACGRIDALFVIPGMFFGGYVYIFLYPPAVKPIEAMFNYGKETLPEITHIPDFVWVILFSAAGLIVIVLTSVKNIFGKSPDTQFEKLETNKIVVEEQISELLTNKENLNIKIDSFETTQMLIFWKNIFFSIIIICLLLLQLLFWLMNQSNYESTRNIISGITIDQVTTVLNISNTILVSSLFLYVLSIFFCLSISLGSNFGGLRNISQSFFSAIVVLVLAFPWQFLFGRILSGMIYTPSELIASINQEFSPVQLYLRFVAYWGFVVLLLIRSQIYSRKWTKTLYERIEQVI